MNKIEEKFIADFFIKHLNVRYGFDYFTQSNDDESVFDGDIDIYAIQKDSETLNLQLKTGEPELEAFWGSRRKHGSGSYCRDFNIPLVIAGIINEAEKKYSNKENLTLLISEKWQPVFDKQLAKFIAKPHVNSIFKGIYLVKLPSVLGISPYEGQVVAIKDIFGNNGEIF